MAAFAALRPVQLTVRLRSPYPNPMTFVEAAASVLRDEGRALTTDELTALVIARGLIESSGLTPARTMSAALYRLPADTAIKREFTPGSRRARRGSVRWVWRPGPPA